jgi:hypothetical protein
MKAQRSFLQYQFLNKIINIVAFNFVSSIISLLVPLEIKQTGNEDKIINI